MGQKGTNRWDLERGPVGGADQNRSQPHTRRRNPGARSPAGRTRRERPGRQTGGEQGSAGAPPGRVSKETQTLGGRSGSGGQCPARDVSQAGRVQARPRATRTGGQRGREAGGPKARAEQGPRHGNTEEGRGGRNIRGQGRSQGPSRAGPEQGSAARIPSAPPGASQGQEPRRAAAGEQSPARRARGDLPDARQVWKPKWPVPRQGGIAGKSGKRGSNHRPQAEGGRSQGGGHRGGPRTPGARKGPGAQCPAGPPQTGTPARDRALQPGYLVPRQASHGDRAPPRGEGRPEPRRAGPGGRPKSPPGAENPGDRSPAGRA